MPPLLQPHLGRKRARHHSIARAVNHPRESQARHPEPIALPQPDQRRKLARRTIIPGNPSRRNHSRLPFLPLCGTETERPSQHARPHKAERYRNGRRESPLNTILPAPSLVMPDVGSWHSRCAIHRLCQPFNSINQRVRQTLQKNHQSISGYAQSIACLHCFVKDFCAPSQQAGLLDTWQRARRRNAPP